MSSNPEWTHLQSVHNCKAAVLAPVETRFVCNQIQSEVTARIDPNHNSLFPDAVHLICLNTDCSLNTRKGINTIASL